VKDNEARTALADYGRRMITDGLSIGTSGNISVRVDDHIAITPSGVAYHEMEPEHVSLVTTSGEHLDGMQPSSELPMHLAIYGSSRAAAVVHTHSPYATALSTVAEELPAIHYTIVQLGGAPVRVVPYSTFGSQDLADNTQAALTGRRAAILANHGTVAYGHTLAAAYDRAQLLEWLCRLYLLALQSGKPRLLSDEELEDVVESARARARGSKSAGPQA
jgi:L-fuculose-phosphate aldolase